MVRQAFFTVVVCLASVSAGAQPAARPERIRIGGLEKYEIPGFATVRTEDSFFEIKSLASPEILTVPRFRHHLTGDALGVDAGLLRLRVDDQRIVLVPLDSIRMLDVSRGRRSRVLAILAGIGAGIGATFAAAFITFASCGLDCEGNALIVAAGVAAGVITGAALAGERWRRMPVKWLETRFAN